MAINYYRQDVDYQLIAKARTARWIERAVRQEGRELGAVNFVFCSPERHLEINRQFLGHDYRTDVITFDYSDSQRVNDGPETLSQGAVGVKNGRRMPKISGDIFIDPETVAANAADNFAAPRVEMRRVMIHGVLHLCGYGDRTKKEQKTMRERENFYLKQYYATI
jgi:rRNA maturation RNase YbeY